MSSKPRKDQDEFPKKEADRRRDELAIRILHTPHKPREELKVGKVWGQKGGHKSHEKSQERKLRGKP